MKKIVPFFLSLTLVALLYAGCKSPSPLLQKSTDAVAEFLMPGTDVDKNLANSVKAEIASDAKDYPLISRSANPQAYAHMDRIFNAILNCGVIKNRDNFEWEVFILDSDVLNAFATPGGKVYVYKGLIKYLDNEAQLAGVVGHEIGHADARHSVKQMTKNQGLGIISDMIMGKNSSELMKLVSVTATNLGGLAFSREDEYEADALGVKYLSHTDYDPLEVGGFFEKLINDKQTSGEAIEFLSTHPASDNRVANIHAEWVKNGSKKGEKFEARYKEFKQTLK